MYGTTENTNTMTTTEVIFIHKEIFTIKLGLLDKIVPFQQSLHIIILIDA